MSQRFASLATDAQPPQERPAFRRLHALGPLGLCRAACLHARGTPWRRVAAAAAPPVETGGETGRPGEAFGAGCRQCVDACPRASLSLRDDRIELDPFACGGCGMCAVHCPTGALAAEGFALPATVPADGITLACERARAAASGAVHRVPCLGGLATNDWLRLALAAGDAPLRLLDDGSCATCADAAAAGAPPWRAVLDTVRRTLAEAGVPAERLPQRINACPLPNGNEAHEDDAHITVAGRRGFLAGLSRSVASALAQAATGDTASAAPATSPPRRCAAIADRGGEAGRALLLRIAQRHGRPHPRHAALPALAASDACRAHGACTRVCPTAALQLETGADGAPARLLFDAWRCIDCGACAALCPSGALHHEARAWRPFATAPVELARIGQCECPRCGALFAAHDDATLCGRCRKAENLARAGFALFHRHRETPAAPAES